MTTMGAGTDLHTPAAISRAVEAIRVHTSLVPDVAIVVDEGLDGLSRAIEVECTLPYDAVPGFPASAVAPLTGRLMLGTLAGKRVVVMQGHARAYEGHSLRDVTFPVRVVRALGAQVLVVTGASGGMHPLWSAGDLMLIADHINLLGDNPLVGPNDPTLGARFPDMSAPYDESLRVIARVVAAAEGIPLREGTYVAVSGPSLGTPAEFRMLRALGADVVGTSTVPEVIVAVQGGMRVLGCAIIAKAGMLGSARAAEPQLTALVRGVVERL
ncbi:MAG TPA: purine-nucleoside phosphorylase [Gemmatimonadaceae bacterium]|nr:purine-nucleoside phosphorylase [Gemmatimonadaceae bacterium]